MLDNERTVLKENVEKLADLLTENIPYLISHYLEKNVLSEEERETIISSDSQLGIKVKLLETLVDKKAVSLSDVIDGLNATENHSVSSKIDDLLFPEKGNDDGSGDKTEDVSVVATSLVDEVIAEAEKATNSSFQQEEDVKEDSKNANENERIQSDSDEKQEKSNHVTNETETVPQDEDDTQIESLKVEENLVEASVEVHKLAEEEEEDVQQNELEENEKEELTITSTEATKALTEPELVESNDVAAPEDNADAQNGTEVEIREEINNEPELITEDDRQEQHETTATSSLNGTGNSEDVDNEDLDNIDIEKEFEMPAESAESNNNNDPVKQSKVANGGHTINDNTEEEVVTTTESNQSLQSTGDEGLDSIMARKELVRKQVEMFEKNSPTKGQVKYSIRSSTTNQEPEADLKGDGSNVKNLKNFFQRLSTTKESTTNIPAGPTKSVGKLKVTFPASS